MTNPAALLDRQMTSSGHFENQNEMTRLRVVTLVLSSCCV